LNQNILTKNNKLNLQIPFTFFQSLNQYTGVFREELRNNVDIQWTPQFDAFLRYGSWLTQIRGFNLGGNLDIHHDRILKVQENFVKELLLHLGNSRYIVI
jgi:hypothetical protein